jgi:hypothetical protein
MARRMTFQVIGYRAIVPLVRKDNLHLSDIDDRIIANRLAGPIRSSSDEAFEDISRDILEKYAAEDTPEYYTPWGEIVVLYDYSKVVFEPG